MLSFLNIIIVDEVFAEKKAIRLLQIIKNSQVTSSYTGSKYTKVRYKSRRIAKIGRFGYKLESV